MLIWPTVNMSLTPLLQNYESTEFESGIGRTAMGIFLIRRVGAGPEDELQMMAFSFKASDFCQTNHPSRLV